MRKTTRRATTRELLVLLPVLCGCGGPSGGDDATRHVETEQFDEAVGVTVCGRATTEACVGFEQTGPGLRGTVVIGERRGGRVAVDRDKGRLFVGGLINGIGDADCREVVVSSVRLADGTLSVVVRNRRPDAVDGCAESAALVRYQAVLAPADARRVSRLDVTHYDHTGEPQLSGGVSVSEGISTSGTQSPSPDTVRE